MNKIKSVRLPSHIQADRYEITIKPDLEAFVFEGEETIHVSLAKPVREITLHSKELEITAVEFIPQSRIKNQESRIKNSINWAGKVRYNEKTETATFAFPKVLSKGKGKLKLTFRGVLGDSLRGLYRSKYVVDGKEKHLAVSQFEATDARRAFPNFDEPAHKAIFDVTMVVPNTHVAISNTLPIDIREHSAGFKAVQFASTPKMSTYLLAFISGEFEYIEGYTTRIKDKRLKIPAKGGSASGGKYKDRTLVRVFTTAGKKEQGRFALKVAIKTIEFFEEYFGIDYPLPVLDMIAIPDFAAGAMENWGAVTYRETQFLVDENNSSAITKQWAAITVAHELAHQWFGNLVTMEWWTHLWLNEGFASYIEYLAIDHIFPEWHMWTQFAYMDYGSALEKDSLSDTHPIEVEVHHPDEIGEIFDGISYHKGASVIRMLATFLGPEDFRKGLQKYLKRHAYANAKTEHLWQAFEEVSGKPVRKMMNAWTSKTGFPVVSVEEKNSKLFLRQHRFFANPKALQKNEDKTIWPIPISFELPKGKVASTLMTARTITLPAPMGPSIPKINAGETSFLRVQYPLAAWQWFIPQIKTKKFGTLDRLGLVSNAYALTRAGLLPTTSLIELIGAYKAEDDYTVWLETISSLGAVTALSYGEPFYTDVELIGRDLVKDIVHKVGWIPKPTDSHTTSMLRAAVLQASGSFGDKATVKHAQSLFIKAKKNTAAVPSDLRSVVYNINARFGGKKVFSELKAMYIAEQSPEEKGRIGRAMTIPRDTGLLEQTLVFSLTKNVRAQDTMRFTDGVGANPVGGEILWEFLKKNWSSMLERYGQGGHLLSRIVEALGHNTDMRVARDIAKFFKTHPAPGAERTIKQVLEQIEINSAWKKRIIKEMQGKIPNIK